MTNPRIKVDGDMLDEFVATNCSVHFEAMSDNDFWIGVTLDDGTTWHIDVGSVSDRAKMYARAELR